VYGLSGPVARYIGRNGPILHRFANEDVTLGAWLVGLEVTHVDERRLCCDSAERCQAQARRPGREVGLPGGRVRVRRGAPACADGARPAGGPGGAAMSGAGAMPGACVALGPRPCAESSCRAISYG